MSSREKKSPLKKGSPTTVILLVALGIVLVVAGFMLGDVVEVINNGSILCLGCIGIG